MLHALRRLGITPDEVDAVVTTHLHWDHAGGLTRRDENGEVELTFKKARHFIQRSEWDFALEPDVRSRPSYITDDFTPLADGNDLVEFLDGDAEVLPGVQIRHVGGHTPGSQVLPDSASSRSVEHGRGHRAAASLRAEGEAAGRGGEASLARCLEP